MPRACHPQDSNFVIVEAVMHLRNIDIGHMVPDAFALPYRADLTRQFRNPLFLLRRRMTPQARAVISFCIPLKRFVRIVTSCADQSRVSVLAPALAVLQTVRLKSHGFRSLRHRQTTSHIAPWHAPQKSIASAGPSSADCISLFPEPPRSLPFSVRIVSACLLPAPWQASQLTPSATGLSSNRPAIVEPVAWHDKQRTLSSGPTKRAAADSRSPAEFTTSIGVNPAPATRRSTKPSFQKFPRSPS
jgi:hypothetical protein